MTRKQIVVCTLLSAVCLPWFPDPLTDMLYRIPTTLLALLVLTLMGRSELLRNSRGGIKRLVAGLTTASIVMLAYIVQLHVILAAMRE